jgi:Icc-related predicted phosphoesterase
MKIHAVADVHSPRFTPMFIASLEKLKPPDLFLMAGDMINRGQIEEYPKILDALETYLGTSFPIVACFGNEEYSEIRDELVAQVKHRLIMLDEISTVLNVDGVKVGVVGTQGSLDKPTSWQRRNIPHIKKIFERRAVRAAELLRGLSGTVDRRILLMHYSPCLETCEGEDDRSFSWLGSRKFYTMIQSEKPDLVIHGHVHNSSVHNAQLGSTLVRNVALPAVGVISEFELWHDIHS